ncbi:DUF4334 domain-containing protein [Mycobacterium sp. TNTM28]|uniref:DUF4334 domain-containing protein n=1 Tax=[Mycobacterium] fortunisiensis TaxID=2600579 RepID=A0ABS6KNG2_9MYCO|nr:DUF4334 domain-containing protein [[Mycobacterium] fortunisiensis]MBU9765103.1 DUF4334 domain-containing protein [[Mycobacterium] fortunisiensis]
MTLDELIGTSAKTYHQIDTLFATLPAVSVNALLGTWRALAIPGVSTVYPILIEKGWYGMRFNDPENVDTMLIASPDGDEMFAADVLKLAAVAPGATSNLCQIRSEIETDQPMGRLRMIDHRGTVTAAMIYDRLPVIDYFRQIDDHAVLCAADARDSIETGYLILQRIT